MKLFAAFNGSATQAAGRLPVIDHQVILNILTRKKPQAHQSRQVSKGQTHRFDEDTRTSGNPFLEGNFAPVQHQIQSANLAVHGFLPCELDQGLYIRTGPNPAHPSIPEHQSWIDGDGMLHAVHLQGAHAVYTSHWVRTERFEDEQKAGYAAHTKVGEMVGFMGMVKIVIHKLKERLGCNYSRMDHGQANTSVVLHAGRLMALHEADMPYEICLQNDGSLNTKGQRSLAINMDGSVSQTGNNTHEYPGPFSAHPKKDPSTGELFFFGCSMEKKPFIRAGMLDANGETVKLWAVDAPYPTLMHDCGLTSTYAVLLHMPLVFDPKAMIVGDGYAFEFKPHLPARIGLLRRDTPTCRAPATAKSALSAPVQWIEVPAFYSFHVANAWETAEGHVVLILCRAPRATLAMLYNKSREVHCAELQNHLWRMELDPVNGKCIKEQQLSQIEVEMPVISPGLAGQAIRYVWAATFDWLHATGIAKFDLEASSPDMCVARITYPQGCYGGEATFVPCQDQHEEDAGWLLVYVHDTNTHTTALHVYDAHTMHPEPVAWVPLPQRVPYGFHGTFIDEEQYKGLSQQQRKNDTQQCM